MKKMNGFTLIEVIISAAILFSAVLTLVPILSIMQTEREVLSTRRLIANDLHDSLQLFLWEEKDKQEVNYTKVIANSHVKYSFQVLSKYVKGCAQWENAKKRKEKFCLYGQPT
ncbi:hypothetical protein GCM10008934_26870 [Virgibacillus salarius]